MDISYSVMEDRIYVATMGRGMWSTPEIGTNTISDLREFDNTVGQVTLFPNPAGSTITVEFPEIEKITTLQIQIYNAMGQRITDAHQFKANRDLTFEVPLQNSMGSSMPAGYYILKVKANGISKGFSFIKSK